MSIRERLGLDRPMGEAEQRANRILTRIGQQAKTAAEAERLFAAAVDDAPPEVRDFLLANGEAVVIAATVEREGA